MAGEELEIEISFEDTTPAKRNQAASDLRRAVEHRAGNDVAIRVEKDDPSTQDMGATLVLLFGTGAAIAIAEGLKAYLAKAGSSIAIRTRGGEVFLQGDAVKGMDVAAIVAELKKRPRTTR
jgi:hypothetical protein